MKTYPTSGIKKSFSILLLLIVVCLCAAGQTKYSRVKIHISLQDVSKLQQSGLSFDHGRYDKAGGFFITTIPQNEVLILRSSPVKFEVIIDDEEKEFLSKNDALDFFKYDNSRNQPAINARLLFDSPDGAIANKIGTPAAFNAGSMGGYLTFSEIKKELDSMVSNYPSLVKLDSIGRTDENRAIWVLKISDNVNAEENEAEILYTGLHHAREPMGMMNLIFFMQYLLENYGTNPRIKELVDNRQLFFIPCTNPDGYDQNFSTNPTGGGLWRKNKRNNGDGTFGVDLNRNYGFGWAYPNGGSSGATAADNYRGPSAFSEKETQLMRDYLRTRNFKLAINYHAYGQHWIHSFCIPTGSLSMLDSSILKKSGNLVTKYNIYDLGTAIETVGYNANGSSDDWFLGGDSGTRQPVYAFSPEAGPSSSGFYPLASSIIPLCKEVFYSNLQSAFIVGPYAKLEDKTPISITSLTGNFDFILQRIGITDSSVRISIIPIQNITSVGASVNLTGVTNYMDTINGSISFNLSPAIAAGQRIRFVWQIVTGGVTILDTVTKFYNPISLFSDGMESGVVGTKWTVTGGWDYTNSSAFSGTNSLTESPVGLYAPNSTATAICNTTFDLSDATAAYLSCWVKYKAENGYDKMQIQLAPNGNGAGAAWTAKSGIHTIAENCGTIAGEPSFTGQQDYWVRELVDLEGYIGYPNVGLRFLFASNAANNDDGFIIDEIEVIKTTNSVLAANVLAFSGIVRGAGVSLAWDASVDEHHHHFEIERSADGVNFNLLGKVIGQMPNRFLDNVPIIGKNYYRLRQVDDNGTVQYSKIITVVFKGEKTATIYPTITSATIRVEVRESEDEKLRFQFIDQMGRMIKQQEEDALTGVNIYCFEVGSFTSQLYYIKIVNDRNEIIDVLSFIKK